MRTKSKTELKNKQAISLIVLIITIIVMIILAGTIIISLNNSGIIDKASNAVEQTNLATVKELAQLGWANAYASGARTEEELKAGVDEVLEDNKVDVTKYEIKVATSGVTVELKGKIPEAWQANIVAIVDGVPIPKGFVASPYGANGDIKAENTKDGGLVIYELAENETEIPSTETQFESWTERNQYVWVPVDDFSKFVRKDFGMSYTMSNVLGENYWETVLNTTTNLPLTTLEEQGSSYMSATTLTEVQAMYASVKEYGGFYIARYEAGIDSQRTSATAALITGKNVHSKMGKIPYNYIKWSASSTMNVDTGAAVEVARGLYSNDSTNTTGVISTLTYGVQWDTIVQWYIDTGAMTLEQVNTTTGSTEYGNYSDHVINSEDELNEEALVWDYFASSSGSYVAKDSETLTYPKASGKYWALSTGALKAANINNIYDMAGNMDEWTMEGRSTSSRALRGGYFRITGTKYPVSSRDSAAPYSGNNDFGFRPTLYIKK